LFTGWEESVKGDCDRQRKASKLRGKRNLLPQVEKEKVKSTSSLHKWAGEGKKNHKEGGPVSALFLDLND